MGMEIIGEGAPLTWEEFISQVNNLKRDLELVEKEFPYQYIRGWIFRGQRDSSWGLESTIERFYRTNYGRVDSISSGQYFRNLSKIIPLLNTLSQSKFDRTIDMPESRNFGWSLKTLELIYYLRHHGFPTPILDWSRSFWVAAFFAFHDADPQKDVSIYAYNESIVGVRGGWVGEAQINTLGHYVQTHRRHFLQQSEYTVCMSQHGVEEEKQLFFVPHEEAISTNPHDHPLKKFILSGHEKVKVLRLLDEANINPYTLFGSEESLMAMLAFREIDT